MDNLQYAIAEHLAHTPLWKYTHASKADTEICKLLATAKHLEILLYINLNYFQSHKLIKTAGQRIFLDVVRENKEGRGSLRTNHALATSLHIPSWFWQDHWETAVSVFFIPSVTTQQGTTKLAKFLNDEWKLACPLGEQTDLILARKGCWYWKSPGILPGVILEIFTRIAWMNWIYCCN